MDAPRDGYRLVLWDVDHTLIETRGVGTRLYIAAFEAVTGRRVDHVVEPTGRTETAIFAETLQRHGIEASDELRQRYAAELAYRYEQGAEELRASGRALPGARAALAALAERSTVVQTVLTGNLRAVARTKLRVFGLDEFIDWEIGAYAEDAIERAKLVGIARARAGDKHGTSFVSDRTVVIGDTTHDVRAAHQGGAKVVAVASGRESIDELRAAGADAVLADLTDTAALLAALVGGTLPTHT